MKRKNICACLLAVAILVCAGAAPRAKSILDEELDQKTIKMLVEQGQLLDLIYDDKGELVHRMCVVLVNAKPDVVWSAITDFQNYDKFVPGMEPPVIKDKKKNEVTVEFTLKINIIMGVSYTQTYSTRYVFKKPILYMYNPEEPKKEPNIWKLVPVDNGARTILYYYDTPPDLTKMGSLVAGVSKAKPEIALALQVSPISILLNQTKSYIEQKMK